MNDEIRADVTSIYQLINVFWKAVVKKTYLETFTQDDVDFTQDVVQAFQNQYMNTPLKPLADKFAEGYLNLVDVQFRKAVR